MGPNVIFFGWNRAIPGRERMGAEHFQEFVGYLGGLQKKGTIQGFDPVFLTTHGGDLNGFFLIRGDAAKLDALMSTQEWVTHMVRAEIHLQGCGTIRGYTGDLVNEMMGIWQRLIPS